MSRLRVDLYDESGRWFESATIARPDPRDWPVSFGVYLDESSRSHRVWARLRGALDGHDRDYRGEAPHIWGDPTDMPPADSAPRLIKDGVDVTPPSVPDPWVTVDRLVLIEPIQDEKRTVSILLHGACLGTSARFGDSASQLVLGQAKSCIATEKTLEVIAPLALDAVDASGTTSALGTWLVGTCATDTNSGRICVPGGATVFGTSELLSSTVLDAAPTRVVGVTPFLIDQREVTVARFRAATDAGFKPPGKPLPNEGELGTGLNACTWSKVPHGREDMSLNCVTWTTARAFCQFTGGDLPTELQWEHAATVAGHERKTHYPWGNDEPDCDHAAFGRTSYGGEKGLCLEKGALPPTAAESANDLSPQGVVGLAGGLSEWTLGAPLPYSDPCWGEAPLVNPSCENASAQQHALRGGNFVLPQMIHPTTRLVDNTTAASRPLGFRCVYPANAP
jgi:formylglycine-generating enzyme required for sulfatase activity